MRCLVFLLFVATSSIKAQKCRTTSDSPSPSRNVPCSFPFRFKGRLRRACITEEDPDGRHWCSTKTEANFDHIPGKGFWGYCRRRNCPKIRKRNNTTIATPTQIPTFTTRPPGTTRPLRITRPPQTTRPPRTNPPFVNTNFNQFGGRSTSRGDYQPTEKEATCGINLSSGFILGGKVTKRGELPFLAALGYKTSNSRAMKYKCGGTLINR